MVTAYIREHLEAIFWSIAGITLVCVGLGVAFHTPLMAIVPCVLLLLLATCYHFEDLFFLLLFLIPLAIEYQFSSFGTDLPTEPLTIYLMIGGMLFLIIQRQTDYVKSYFMHPISILVVAHVFWAFVSMIYAADHLVAIKYLLAKFWYVVVFYFLAGQFLNTQDRLRRMFWVMNSTTLFVFAYSMYNHAKTGFSFDTVNYVVRPFFRNHVTYGIWGALFVPFTLMATQWYPKGSLKRLAVVTGLLLSLSVVYFSYTRGAWVALVVIALLYMVVQLRLMKPFVVAGILGALALSVYFIHDNTYLDYAPNFETTIYHEDLSDHLNSTFELEDMSTMERFHRWIAAIRMATDHPFVGVGPSNFVDTYKSYTVTSFQTYISDNEEGSTVHNYFLLLLSEQGVPAFLIMFLLIIWVFIVTENIYYRVNDKKDKRIILMCFLGFTVLLVNNFFSDLLEADKIGPMFFMLLAVLVSYDIRSKKLTHQNTDVIGE